MKLADKVKDALDEIRILVLGSQILVGFQYNAVFYEQFDALPPHGRYLAAVALLLMLAVVVLLLFPPAWHRIVVHGADSSAFLHLVTMTACAALVPFALSLGLDLFIVLEQAAGVGVATVIGGLAIIIAVVLWFGIELWRRRIVQRKNGANATRGEQHQATPLAQRITQMMTEARVILPGAQALLGFQLAIILTRSFETIPESSRLVHVASLCAIALSVILLMAPAAYHRIVNEGEPTAEFHRIGSFLIMAATVPLAIGLCGDLYVVIEKIIGSAAFAAAIAATAFIAIAGLWYVYPILVRRARTGAVTALPPRTRSVR